jgi:hypothetical protein
MQRGALCQFTIHMHIHTPHKANVMGWYLKMNRRRSTVARRQVIRAIRKQSMRLAAKFETNKTCAILASGAEVEPNERRQVYRAPC